MTLKEIKIKVKEIKEISGDDERAHALEDALQTEFIEFIAYCGCELSPLAKQVLKTKEVEFSRWCA